MDKSNYLILKNQIKEEGIRYKEFYLKKDKLNYKCILKIEGIIIMIKIENYEVSLYLNELQELTKKKFNSIGEFFDYFQIYFEKKQVYIKEIELNEIIILVFKTSIIYNNSLENPIELILIHKNVNKDYLINYLNKNGSHLNKEISQLYIKNNNLNQNFLKRNYVINKTISFSLINNLEQNSPIYMQFYKEISNNCYAHFALENTFILVNSISDIPYIIYSTKSKSIISQNAINFQIICEIKNAHEDYITNFRHFLDDKNKKDIIMSISAENNNIKLWDLNNWNCLKDLKNINQHGSLFSACFYWDIMEEKNIIITSNDNYSNSENIKLFDFDGNKIKEINNSNHRTYLIDIFYDDYNKKYFIVTGNELGVISYDIEDNKIYNKYLEKCDDIFLNDHNSFVVTKDINITKIIESCEDGCIRIWDFHSSKLLNKINICDNKLYGICLWNKDYLFVGCDDNTLKLIDLKKNFVINNIKTEGFVINIRKIDNIKYKYCLITQDWRNQIKIWKIKN